jgi:hypothetical protein
MRTQASASASAHSTLLEKVRLDLEHWRRTRRQRSPIPKALWKTAVEVAAQCGLTRTARILRLDFNGLKHRLALSDLPKVSKPTSSSAFMELLPVLPTTIPDCLVELEDGRGTRLKIQLKGAGSQEVLSISRGLWSLSA